jgi:hypothetical protein
LRCIARLLEAMQSSEKVGKRALRQSPVARKSRVINLAQRLAFSPGEAGVLVGKSGTYIYRQIYSGRIKPIADCGRMMIPRAELDRFLSRTAEYNGGAITSTAGDGDGQSSHPSAQKKRAAVVGKQSEAAR